MAHAKIAILNEDSCPISEELWKQVHKATPPDAAEIAKSLPEPQRARLATFCYNKRHLYALGLMIASTCDQQSLVEANSVAGDTIYRQSRDPNKTLSQEIHRGGFRPLKISLAGPNDR